MLPLKRLNTKKLFYKRWLYKIVVKCDGLGYLRRHGLPAVTNLQPRPSQTNSSHAYYWRYDSETKAFGNKTNLIEFGVFLEEALSKYPNQIRVEGDHCGVFTNSLDLVELIEKKYKKYVIEIHSPVDDKIAGFLGNNKNKVVCNELPYENYRFKVYFKNGVTLSDTFKGGFLKWAEKFEDGRIHLPQGTRRVLEGDHPYCYGQYFYAKDSKIASMALMFMGDYLNKTEEYVLKTEIA